MVDLYDLYTKQLKLYTIDNSKPMKVRYEGLLVLLSRINKRFDAIFKKTVESVPGMRMYLLTHVVFDKDDKNTYDWFTKFMLVYLMPTKEDIEELKRMQIPPEGLMEKFAMFNPEYLPDFYDETIIKVGMWRRDDRDWLANPIEVIDTFDLPDLVVDKRIVAAIIEEAGVIDLSIRPSEPDPMDELPF